MEKTTVSNLNIAQINHIVILAWYATRVLFFSGVGGEEVPNQVEARR